MKELTIKQLRLPTRLTQREFAEKFDIPLKTLQKWEQGTSKPASYIPKMIYTILQMELKLNTFYPHMNCMACDPEGMCIIENAVCNLHTCIHKNYEELAELEEEMEKIKIYISWNICPVCTNDCALCPLYSLLLEGEKNE